MIKCTSFRGIVATKEQWESEEASEDVLNNLLRVKKLSQRVSSIESDGLPSMASVDVADDNVSVLSESSDLQRARKMYADLQAMSMDSAASQENLADLDAYAREFYNEIRALSVCTGGSIENILDNIGASCESLSSLIPQEKRQELVNFEMNLKQMIEEAKMLAESESVEDLHKTPVREVETVERSRSRRSEESVVSVIEFPPALTSRDQEDQEPLPMSRRGVPTKRSPVIQPPMRPSPPLLDEQLPPPPLEEMEPPPSAPSRASSKATPQPPAGGRGRVVNREPSVGSDRYEEIIVETRRRSQSRSRMGSRNSSVVDFRNSNASLGKIDLDRNINGKAVAALDLDTKNEASRIIAAKLADSESPASRRRLPAMEPPKPKVPEQAKVPVPVSKQQPAPVMAMDANGNATAPSLPSVTRPPRAVTPDPLVKLFPKNIPDWFMITYTYSVVLIFILLIANVTPDGKLYIHFTAFWSLIIYFVLEDEQVSLNVYLT